MGWVCRALEGAELQIGLACYMNKQFWIRPAPVSSTDVALAWVRDQKSFFESRLLRVQRVGRRYQLAEWVCFAFSLLVTILSCVSVGISAVQHSGSETFLGRLAYMAKTSEIFPLELFGGPSSALSTNMVQVVLGVLLGSSALFFYIRSQRGLDDTAVRYKYCAELFGEAEDLLNNSGEHDPQRLLHQLGCESLNENGDWVWLQKSLPMEIPK
jgi:hypothetical protein